MKEDFKTLDLFQKEIDEAKNDEDLDRARNKYNQKKSRISKKIANFETSVVVEEKVDHE